MELEEYLGILAVTIIDEGIESLYNSLHHSGKGITRNGALFFGEADMGFKIKNNSVVLCFQAGNLTHIKLVCGGISQTINGKSYNRVSGNSVFDRDK